MKNARDLKKNARDLKELTELQERELLDFQQHDHINWLTQCDQSTAFFGSLVKIRQSKNSITRTLERDGNPATNLAEMKSCAMAHFTQLFSCKANHKP